MNCNNHKATDVGKKKELLNWYTLYSWKKNCSSLFSNHYRFILWNGPYLNSSFQTFYHLKNYLSSKYCSHFFKDVHVKSVFFHWQPYIQFCPKTVFSCYFFFIQILIVIFYPRVISLVLIECFQKFLVRDLCLVFFP